MEEFASRISRTRRSQFSPETAVHTQRQISIPGQSPFPSDFHVSASRRVYTTPYKRDEIMIKPNLTIGQQLDVIDNQGRGQTSQSPDYTCKL